ncbi:MAG: chitobiase/beta-hexosaminidase C-terminal domain-containing protein, partial [Kiritimatiellae bacterium]|nr:chitobiase/beta-hexosaminidase C-terminal domain-containing protein [Kiritimatiellia bacterium]
MKLKTMFATALGALAAGFAAAGDLAVSAYWQDPMVLQRGKNITVWGKDAPGRTVTVSFTNQTATATTGTNGYWETTFAQPFALSATPQALTITDSASESITLSDVLVGDVYLASGQSNMDRRLKYGDFDEPQSVKDFCRDDDGIRFIRIAKSYENSPAGEELFDLPPLKEIDVNVGYRGEGFDWAPATMGGAASNKYHVSSVALNFAHYIRRANAEKGQDIPIGIIHASYGGTYIRHWIRPAAIAAGGFQTVSTDARCWNIMLAPILRAKFCAVLWYQGCSDADTSCVNDYKAMMDILVKDWRARWGENGNLPFYAVQIGAPNYNSASGTIGLDQYPAPTEDNVGHNYAPIREHQRRWNMSDAGKHGLVTIVDCVDCLSNGSLHPTDKNFVGRRLSLLARRDIYGETDLPAEGPVFTRAVRESDGSVRVFFKSGTARGLTAGRMRLASQTDVSSWVKKSTDPIRGFAVCGSDNVWKDAVATVEGETIVLRAADVATPTKFHYGYWCVTRETLLEDGQRLNLYNEAGLPMSPVAPQTVEDAAASTQVADPVLMPASCFFSPSTNVTIACATSGATIRYTLNGSEPDETSAVYSAPITISATTTVKARAFAANKDPSDVVFATYTLGEAPAQEPNPLWEPGMYKFAEWTPLANNLLSGLTTSYVVNSLDPWNGSVVCLTDGSVSSNLDDDTVGIGIRDGATLSWSFTTPKTIETIRLTACGYNHMYKYDKILVESVEVLQNGEWNQIGGSVAFNGLDSYGSDQSLYATLADEVTGRLATNATGLRITFGNPKNLGKCRYAEIEASGYDTSGGTVGPVEPITPVAGSLVVDTTISDHCVLQRGTNNCVKGTATVGSTVTVTFGGVSASAVAGSDGSFSVSINPGAANATGRDLVVSDTVNTVTITDVVVGDVWYISGQSNVRYTVDALAKSKALADCDYPSLRMMMLPSANPGLISASDAELPCAWSVCSATTCTNMSATGFFFGRELVKAENVPVGVVVAAINGSYIANWLPNANCDNYMASRANHIALKGAVWYQGESDALNYSDRSYPNRLKSLVRHLRTRPGNEGLPVVVVQLPRYRDTYINCGNQAAINCWGIFRVDQDLAAADMDGVVCVPTIEYGAEYNIHPSDKDLMGARIALAARNLAYGENVAYRCPYPTSVEKNEAGTTVTVTFPETTTLVATNDTASVLFGEDREMFSVGGANVMPAISADGHSLVFTGSFADATSVEYGICGYPKILFVDANGFPMPPFSLELTGGGSGGEPVETAATPTFSPAACSFYPTTNITLTCTTSGATIRYTLNGSDPTAESAIYTAPIALSTTTTVKARAFAEGMNASAVASATYTYAEPGNPPDDPPSEEPGLVWTTGDYDPASWTALENNILAGLTAVATDASLISFAASKDLSKLTDGVVDQTADSANLVGFRVGAEIAWTFAEPMTVRKLRFQSLQEPDKKIYAGIRIADVLVQTSHSS